MGNFSRDNRDSRDGNRRDFKRRGFSGGGTDRQMYKAICSECGRECEVPFKPTGDKPVFCSNCFEKKGSTEPRRYNDRNSRRSNYADKQMYPAVCDSCGRKCEVPFQPTTGKPIYCSECFKKIDGGADSRRFQDRSPRRPDFERRNQSGPQNSEQFEAINRKLDKILEMLTMTTIKEEKETKAKPEEITIIAQKKTKTFKKKTPVTKE